MIELSGIDLDRSDLLTEINSKFVEYLDSESFEKDIIYFYKNKRRVNQKVYYSISQNKVTLNTVLGDSVYGVRLFSEINVVQQKEDFLAAIEKAQSEFSTIKREDLRVDKVKYYYWPTLMLNEDEFAKLISTMGLRGLSKNDSAKFLDIEIDFFNGSKSKLLDKYIKRLTKNNAYILMIFKPEYMDKFFKDFDVFKVEHTNLANSMNLNKYLFELFLNSNVKDKESIINRVIFDLINEVNSMHINSRDPFRNKNTRYDYFRKIVQYISQSSYRNNFKPINNLNIEDLKYTTDPVLIMNDVYDYKTIDLIYSLNMFNVIFIFNKDSFVINDLHMGKIALINNRKTCSYYVSKSAISKLESLYSVFEEVSKDTTHNDKTKDEYKDLKSILSQVNELKYDQLPLNKKVNIYKTKSKSE